jgi:uncharacterized membrane protein
MATNRETAQGERSLGSLFSELTREMTTLVRQEIQLAKAETSEKVSQAMSGVVALVAGGITLFAGLLVLEYAAILGLDVFFELWVATLIVAALNLIVGVIAVMSGRSRLKAANLAPQKTAESLRRDTEFAKEQVR